MLSADEKVEELFNLLQRSARRTGGGDSGGSDHLATIDHLERRLRQAEASSEQLRQVNRLKDKELERVMQ